MSDPKRLRLDPALGAPYNISSFDPTPNPGSDTRRRSSRADPRRRFECTHPGCGRDYSRAEHLYRHQLNRESLQVLLVLVSTADTDQIIPRRSSNVTIQDVHGLLYDKISAFVTETVTTTVISPLHNSETQIESPFHPGLL